MQCGKLHFTRYPGATFPLNWGEAPKNFFEKLGFLGWFLNVISTRGRNLIKGACILVEDFSSRHCSFPLHMLIEMTWAGISEHVIAKYEAIANKQIGYA